MPARKRITERRAVYETLIGEHALGPVSCQTLARWSASCSSRSENGDPRISAQPGDLLDPHSELVRANRDCFRLERVEIA